MFKSDQARIKIKKVRLKEYFDVIEQYDKAFCDKLIPVYKNLKKHERYAYVTEFPYGCPIIDDGTMHLLQEDNSISRIKIANEFDGEQDFNNQSLWQQFIEDCKRNSDHPLTMVLRNSVEVFTEHFSGVDGDPPYKFPLKYLNEGELFGVFGTIDLMCNIQNKKQNWGATAGKSCFQFLLPLPEPNKSYLPYQEKFNRIFDFYEDYRIGDWTKQDFLTQAFLSFINSNLQLDTKTKTLIFPEHYFILQSDEINPIKKIEFQNYLYGYGWKQFEKQRNLLWANKADINRFAYSKNYNHYNFQILKHIEDITKGNAYALSLVSKEDEILYEAFKELCLRFRNNKLLEYCTPLFFHYKKRDNNKYPQWMILPYYAPALNIHIPEITRNPSGNFIKNFIHEIQNRTKCMDYNLLNFNTFSKKNNDDKTPTVSLTIKKDSNHEFSKIKIKAFKKGDFEKTILPKYVGKNKKMLSEYFSDEYFNTHKFVNEDTGHCFCIKIPRNKSIPIFNSSILIDLK